MNRLRKVLADKIRKNGGYSRNYQQYAIEYDVSLWASDTRIGNLYKVACKEFGYIPPITGLEAEWNGDDQYCWANEDMCRNLFDKDMSYAYRTYSPATAKRYGLPYYNPRSWERISPSDVCYYPAKKAGWKLKDPYCVEDMDVKFGLAGRGGKHLVIEEFEGRKLNVYSNDLADEIESGEDYGYGSGRFSNRWCVLLLAMMEEWERCFTGEAASRELEYLMADQLYQQQSERADAWREALKNARTARDVSRMALVMAAPMTTTRSNHV